MNKADNLPMSAEVYYDNNNTVKTTTVDLMEEYANYLLSHHINVLAERKYSEEDLKEAYMEGGDCDSIYKTFYEWFEQFKNK